MKEQERTKLKTDCTMWQRLLFLALMTVASTAVFAQGKVSGTVVDATGETIIGASVAVKVHDQCMISHVIIP